MARKYRMQKRADALDTTRDRILKATMELHDEQGVASTTFGDVAERAGLGQATVRRHFATLSELVQSCGMHVWQIMRPPTPDSVAAVFDGMTELDDRLARLVRELDDFYARSGFRLLRAAQDRDRVPELDAFLNAVGAGLESLVRAALADEAAPDTLVHVLRAVTSVSVWADFERANLPHDKLAALKFRILKCTIGAARASLPE